MTTSQNENFDLVLAEVVLKTLTGALDPIFAIQECTQLTLQYYDKFHRNFNYVVQPALLEGFVELAQKFPPVKESFLTCLLILSSLSVHSWKTLTSSGFHNHDKDFGWVIARTVTNSNPSLQGCGSASRKISDALLELCNPDTFSRDGRSYVSPVTPLVVSLQTFIAERNEQHQQVRDLILSCLHIVPPEAWRSVNDDDFSQVLEMALPLGFPLETVRHRLHTGFAKPTPAGARVLLSLRNLHDSDVAKAWINSHESAQSSLIPIIQTAEQTRAEDVSNIEAAFQFAKACITDGRNKDISRAAMEWMSKRQFNFVAAAYVATPHLLYRIVEGKRDVSLALRELPTTFLRSDIDAEIDEKLIELLCTIPEFGKIFGKRKGDTKHPSMILRRKALSHPFLVGRRLKCFCSSGKTIITGFNDPSVKYQKTSFSVLEILFGIILCLPDGCYDLAVAESFCEVTLQFLVDEKRLENGVPEMFADLSVVMFKTLWRCYRSQGKGIETIANSVRNAKGTCDTAREAADSFLRGLKHKR